MRLFLYVLSNVGITLGYIFLAVAVVPRVRLHLKRTLAGGVGFFVLCGLHHLLGVFDVLFMGHTGMREGMLDIQMLVVDIPQVVAVWLFVTGLYIELVRWGPLDSHDAFQDLL